MTDRPIIFSGPMVRALLDGRKTMTRRLAWTRRHVRDLIRERRPPEPLYELYPSPWQRVQPGNRLWVRESLATHGHFGFPLSSTPQVRGDQRYWSYMADDMPNRTGGRPSIHMPRWASRITLIVTAARVERLQAIDEADARSEGLEWVAPTWGVSGIAESWNADPRLAFAELWDTLHEPPNGWANDPFVVALSCTVHRCNIDDMKEASNG